MDKRIKKHLILQAEDQKVNATTISNSESGRVAADNKMHLMVDGCSVTLHFAPDASNSVMCLASHPIDVLKYR